MLFLSFLFSKIRKTYIKSPFDILENADTKIMLNSNIGKILRDMY